MPSASRQSFLWGPPEYSIAEGPRGREEPTIGRITTSLLPQRVPQACLPVPKYITKSTNLIQLTPGVKIEKGSDGLGQNYNDPEYVVLEKGADIAVVGRGIISSSDPEKTAALHKEKLWNAYLKRIG